MTTYTTLVIGLVAGLACALRDDEAHTASPSPSEHVVRECTVDADCVPAECCHPSACVPAAKKPDCHDVGCEMVEVIGSLDGASPERGIGCLCIDGQCGARLNTCEVVHKGEQPRTRRPSWEFDEYPVKQRCLPPPD